MPEAGSLLEALTACFYDHVTVTLTPDDPHNSGMPLGIRVSVVSDLGDGRTFGNTVGVGFSKLLLAPAADREGLFVAALEEACAPLAECRQART